jgi:hypothetical protein
MDFRTKDIQYSSKKKLHLIVSLEKKCQAGRLQTCSEEIKPVENNTINDLKK